MPNMAQRIKAGIFIRLLLTLSIWKAIAFEIKYPQGVHTFTLTSTSIVKVQLTWSDRDVDFDLYIYDAGQNLLSNSLYRFRGFNTWRDKELAISSISAGDYYVRVDLYTYTIDYPVEYSIQVEASGEVALEETGIAMRKDSRSSVLRYYSNQYLENGNCQVEFWYSGLVSVDLRVFEPSDDFDGIENKSVQYTFASNVNNESLSEQILTPDGEWFFVFQHNLTIAITVQTFNFEIEPIIGDFEWSANCSLAASSPPEEEQEAAQQINQLNLTLIISLAVGLPCLMIFLISLMCCYFYRKKHMQRVSEGERRRDSSRVRDASQLELGFSKSKIVEGPETCSICLEGQCSEYLPCGHFFHKDCLKTWGIKNSICPMCRKKFKLKYLQQLITNK